MTWPLAQVIFCRGLVRLFCRGLVRVNVIGSKGIPAALWHQVSSPPPYILLGTGSHSGFWQALPGDSDPASAYLPGLSRLAHTTLGKSVHKWVLRRLCQEVRGGERRKGWRHGLWEHWAVLGPPSISCHEVLRGWPHLWLRSGTLGQQMQILKTLLSGFKFQLPHVWP